MKDSRPPWPWYKKVGVAIAVVGTMWALGAYLESKETPEQRAAEHQRAMAKAAEERAQREANAATLHRWWSSLSKFRVFSEEWHYTVNDGIGGRTISPAYDSQLSCERAREEVQRVSAALAPSPACYRGNG
jgi:hypothetical protein